MPARDARQPRVELRRRRRKDGGVSEIPTVRFYDADGVRRRKTCSTIEEANFECARLALELSHGRRPPGTAVDSLTLAGFWPTWLADAQTRLAEHTLDDYRSIWRRRLEPRFGHVLLDEVTPRSVAAWRGELLAAGAGREAVRKAMVLLQAMFTVAIEWGEASTNPVSVVRKPRQGRERAIRVIPPEDVERVRAELLEVGDLMSATIVSVLAYAGVRPGELLALEPQHIRQDTILIEQAVAKGRLKLQKTGRLYRTVDLLAPLAGDLALWLERRGSSAGPLFARSDGGWFRTTDWNNWRKRCFYEATVAAGIGQPRPYDLRHSFASLRIREKDLSLVDLAAQLGHSPTETLKTYSHVFAEFRRQPARAAEQLIAETRRAANPPAPEAQSRDSVVT